MEIEVPIEKIQEDLHHKALHAKSSTTSAEHSENRYVKFGALLSAILAAFAAISSLMAGHYSSESMIEQIESSDRWAYYQAKGIKAAIADLKNKTGVEDSTNLERYKSEQQQIKSSAEEAAAASRQHLSIHQKLAASVTFFQIAIALTAIAVLAQQSFILWISSSLGLLGILGVIGALIL